LIFLVVLSSNEWERTTGERGEGDLNYERDKEKEERG
jgi:hypothetical protein